MYFLLKNEDRGDIWIAECDRSADKDRGWGYVREIIKNSFIEWKVNSFCIIWENEVLDRDNDLNKLKERMWVAIL